jgi:hypothetical protein
MEVGEVAVEQDGCPGLEELHEGQPGAQLVDKEGIGPQGGKLTIEVDLYDEVQLPSDGAKNAEPGKDRRRENAVAAYANLESSLWSWSQQLTMGY